MSREKQQVENTAKREAGTTIPELNKEAEFPAQGAYVGHLITDFLYSRVTSQVTEVVYEDGCVFWALEVNQYEDGAVVDLLPLAVTFNRGTIALLFESEEWWDAMEQSILFERLWTIAEHTGCLIALSALQTNAAKVWDPEVERKLDGRLVHQPPVLVQ